MPDLRVVLINESHRAFDGLDGPTLEYDLSRVAWHEWGHALSLDRAEQGDIAAGKHYDGIHETAGRIPSAGGTTMADVRRLELELLASEGLDIKDLQPGNDADDDRPTGE